MRARRAAVLPAALAAAATLGAGCGPPCQGDADCPDGSGCRDGFCARECASNVDCPAGTDCGVNFLCGPPAAGEITWVSPSADGTVGASFDAELEVTFRAATGLVHVERNQADPGDGCAPFVPFDRELLGDAQQDLTQRVTVPGLLALGEQFTLRATLQSSAGGRLADLPLHGPATGTGGARFTQPDAERAFDATMALTMPVGAVLDHASALLSVFVEPLGAVPGPVSTVGAGLSSFADWPVLVAHGPQVIWLDVDGTRCGVGVQGVGASDTGLEVGLRYTSGEPAQLGLRLLVEGDAGATSCGFLDPGTACEAVRETTAPTTSGEQVMRVPLADGVVQIAAVPGAAGGFVTAEVRVSVDGRHLGWLGPYPIQTGAGESWIAGQVVVGGGEVRLSRTDEVTVGAPW